MSPLQQAYESVKGVYAEMLALRSAGESVLGLETIRGEARDVLERALAGLERTYLLRLYTEFESALDRVALVLTEPIAFGEAAGLKVKMDRIGRAMGMDRALRQVCDRDIRQQRNSLLHGQSLLPAVPIEETVALMKQFLRHCR